MADHFSDPCKRARTRYEAALESRERALQMAILDASSAEGRQRVERAEQRLAEARRELVLACGNEILTVSLAGGGRVNQEPGVSNAGLEKILELIRRKIPERDLQGLDDLTLSDDPPPERERWVDDSGGRRKLKRYRPEGNYSIGERDIVVWPTSNEETVKHEIGHHVYYHRLSVEQRQTWDRYWAANQDRMPTEYARQDAQEGFAEAYEFFRNGKTLDEGIRSVIGELAGPNPPN